jgi:hypothetical protein
MEGQREKTSSRRRQRRKSKAPRNKVVVEPVLIVARRPDSPLLKNGFHNVVASAQPKHSSSNGRGVAGAYSVASDYVANGHAAALVVPGPVARSESAPQVDDALEATAPVDDGAPPLADSVDKPLADNRADETPRPEGVRRRAVRIVKLTDQALSPGNREQQLLDRLVRSQGRGAISRAADDLWESKYVAPKRQEVQIQLLEHENEHRARDAVFAMAELLQREAPIKRPVLDQRLRRLEQSAEDPITRDAAGALRRSMRVHHGA